MRRVPATLAAGMRRVLATLAAGMLVASCSAGPPPPGQSAGRSSPSTASSPSQSPSPPPSPSPSQSPSTVAPTDPATPTEATARPEKGAAHPRVAAELATIRLLAGRIGPREATSAAFARAARIVASRWRSQGYVVSRDPFRVPAGVSWGVGVPAGRTANVVALPPHFEPHRPHVLVGAHLDTVPQAPGAEDNASGIAVLLELSRLASVQDTRAPVVFVAFGAEEPRGEGDELHHFGSQAYVDRMTSAQENALSAMVSLDRVGVGASVPVCTGGLSPLRVMRTLLERARRLGIPASGCTDNQASDHWSFEKNGTAAARVGGTPYAAYHSAADRPGVVQPDQLRRVSALVWAWLRAGR